MARLQGFDRSIEEVAASLGAGRIAIFLRVTLPQLMAGIIAGAAFAFTTSFDEFNVAYFVIGSGTRRSPCTSTAACALGSAPSSTLWRP